MARRFVVDIERGDWRCVEDFDVDSSGFKTRSWAAIHRETGECRLIPHSRFRFTMTAERFAFLVDHDFPAAPAHPGFWTSQNIDAAMQGAA